MNASTEMHEGKDGAVEENGEIDGSGSEETEVVLDLSGRRLKRLERAPLNQTFATALVLDNNHLQNLANLDSYGELERLSIANNQIVRMYWFARMYSLRILNLPNNNIVQIEGLRELHHLIHLNLSGNNLKAIEGLCHSHKLEHLNLSGNFFNQISDLFMLKNLKELFLHRNRITSLHRCNKYLPPSLFILTLSDNCISDLNELCNLSHLTSLEQFTFLNNPCLDPLQQIDENNIVFGPPLAFDNRPYVINWCLNLKVLDGYKVTPKESLKAEWLYSQGKGRGFQIGEHVALVQYLSGVCLAGGGWGGAELPDDDVKLGKILQLAKQHQHELRNSSVNGHDNSDSSSGRGSRGSNHHDSPASLRRSVPRTTSLRRNTAPQHPVKKVIEKHNRSKSHSSSSGHMCAVTGHQTQDINAHSYHVELSSTLYGGDLRTPDTPSLMTQSMDPSLLAHLSTTEPHSSIPSHPMSQSLGPEQMARSLKVEHMLSSYSGSVLNEDPSPSLPDDLMSQSLGPEQLQRSLMEPGTKDEGSDHRAMDHPVRPTRLFSQDDSERMFDVRTGNEGSHLEGSSEFVPAPESIISPEYQSMAGPQVEHQLSSCQRVNATVIPKSSSSYSSKPMKPTVPPRPAVASQSSPRMSCRSASTTLAPSQRPRTTPLKSPAPDPSRGSPRSQQRSQSTTTPPPPPPAVGNMSPRLRQSPKPAPRSSRISVANTTLPANVPLAMKAPKSSTPPKEQSEGDSDNTDSEISVSKLQTIKSIAAERRGRERRGTGTSKGSEDNSCNEKIATSAGAQNFRSSRTSTASYNPEKYRGSPQLRSHSRGRKASNSSGGSLDSLASSRGHSVPRGTTESELRAALTIQRHWRGFRTRHKNHDVRQIREEIRQSRAEDHIRYLTEKLRAAEAALERERKLRHLQLDAIRTLWREIQKLQAGRKDGLNTPSTPMTPLTPLTPLEGGKRSSGSSANKNKVYSEQSVKELTDFCTSLQTQVSQLQESLSMVTQVMNAFCHLPGSQSLLTMSQSSGSGVEKSNCEDEMKVGPPVSQSCVPLKQSVTSFTNSIAALTSSIVKNEESKAESRTSQDAKGKDGSPIEEMASKVPEPKAMFKQENGPVLAPQELAASITSLASNDLNSTGQDVSTLSNDSNEVVDTSQQQEEILSDPSRASLSPSPPGMPTQLSHEGTAGSQASSHHHSQHKQRPSGPPRPSTLPVARPLTPRTSS